MSSQTPNLGLNKPDVGETGWGGDVNANWDKIDSALAGGVFVPRLDDPATADFTASDLTTDGNWHDLDLSSIVPAKATAVAVRVYVKDDAAGSFIQFRRNGATNKAVAAVVRTQVSDVYSDGFVIVACDSASKIEYRTSNVSFTALNIVICGWFYSEA